MRSFEPADEAVIAETPDGDIKARCYEGIDIILRGAILHRRIAVGADQLAPLRPKRHLVVATGDGIVDAAIAHDLEHLLGMSLELRQEVNNLIAEGDIEAVGKGERSVVT